MTETILYLIAGVLVLAVLRSVLGVVFKGVADFFEAANGPQQQRSAPRSTPLSEPEPLKRDPVCGTFLPASTAVTKTVSGQTYYFCSTACRDKFKA